LRERVGGAAFFFRRFEMGFVEAEAKDVPPGAQAMAAGNRRRCVEMERAHYHIDWFERVGSDIYPTRSSEPLDKTTASRLFAATVEELRRAVGPMTVTRGEHPLFPGCVVRAENHRVVVVLSRCDCGSSDDTEAEAH
jgi:hypothetical protein